LSGTGETLSAHLAKRVGMMIECSNGKPRRGKNTTEEKKRLKEPGSFASWSPGINLQRPRKN